MKKGAGKCICPLPVDETVKYSEDADDPKFCLDIRTALQHDLCLSMQELREKQSAFYKPNITVNELFPKEREDCALFTLVCQQ